MGQVLGQVQKVTGRAQVLYGYSEIHSLKESLRDAELLLDCENSLVHWEHEKEGQWREMAPKNLFKKLLRS